MDLALVDTDILSEMLRAKNPEVGKRSRVYVGEHGRLTISVVTVFEVVRGWHRVGRPDRSTAFLAWLPAAELLFLDSEVAALAGEIDGALERSGQRVGVADVLIAATAIRASRVLVTGNTDHYARMQKAGFPLAHRELARVTSSAVGPRARMATFRSKSDAMVSSGSPPTSSGRARSASSVSLLLPAPADAGSSASISPPSTSQVPHAFHAPLVSACVTASVVGPDRTRSA
jgi:predicted nucleic acid-binding protein